MPNDEHDKARDTAILELLREIKNCATTNPQYVLPLANAWAVLTSGRAQNETARPLPQA